MEFHKQLSLIMEPIYLEGKSNYFIKNEKSNFEPHLLNTHRVTGKKKLTISLYYTYHKMNSLSKENLGRYALKGPLKSYLKVGFLSP